MRQHTRRGSTCRLQLSRGAVQSFCYLQADLFFCRVLGALNQTHGKHIEQKHQVTISSAHQAIRLLYFFLAKKNCL
jgi:hypothetical protein